MCSVAPDSHFPFLSSRRFSLIAAILTVLLLSVQLGGNLLRSTTEKEWAVIGQEESVRLARELEHSFALYRDAAARRVGEIAQHPGVADALALGGDSVYHRAFELLQAYTLEGSSLELYDAGGSLIAWNGRQGALLDSAMLRPHVTSALVQDPLYKYFIVASPVVRHGSIAGHLVAKYLFEVTYPISNRFINSGLFAATFTSRLTVEGTFTAPDVAALEQNGSMQRVELSGVDGRPIMAAFLPKPTLASRIDEITLRQRQISIFLSCILLLVIAVFVLQRYRPSNIRPSFLVVSAAALVGLRYLLLLLDVPSVFIAWDVFGPDYFASPFGAGIARSLGDLFLSALFLLPIVLLSVAATLRWLEKKWEGRNGGQRPVLRLAGGLALATLFFLITRGFAAFIRSAVVDSNLRYNDPAFIVPPFATSLMFLAMFLTAVSIALVSALLVIAVRRLLIRRQWKLSETTSWALTFLVFLTLSFVYGYLHPSPLSSFLERGYYLAGALTLAILSVKKAGRNIRFFNAKAMVAVFLTAGIFVIDHLDYYVHEEDRSRVQLVAGDLLRPADEWLTFVVNQTLAELSAGDARAAFESGTPAELQKLAFTGWAKSILSREGYDCWLFYVDSTGRPVSDFHIGLIPHGDAEYEIADPAISLPVGAEEKRMSGGETIKLYSGYSPIYSDDGRLEGGVGVKLSADRQSLLGGDAPEILRNYAAGSGGEIADVSRTLIVSEYHQGRLLFTSAENISAGRALPPEVHTALVRGTGGVWVNEIIDGQRYATYYMPHDEFTVIGLSMEERGLRWHLFSTLRLMLFYLLWGVLGLLVAMLVLFLRGRRFTANFRVKLLAAFMVVSLIPIVLLAFYNREFAIERNEERTISQLERETRTVAAALQRQGGITVPADLATLTDYECEELAALLGVNFNVYGGTSLAASSKPEVFMAELFDPRLDADACLNVVLRKKSFFADRDAIGVLPYIVGYRPLLAENGMVLGVVAVPTLYRQQQIDEDVMRRNAYLFATYTLVLIFAVAIGLVFANQISSPVRRLQEATRRIAGGDLTPSFRTERADEFGELEQAFDAMTRDLQASQEELVKHQRELAWKEMAQQVAHEIKNPLTPMKLSVQHLRQAYRDGIAEFGTLLNQVSTTLLEQIETLSRIASEFSHFARMPERRLELCDVHGVIEEAVRLFGQHAGTNFSLSLRAARAVVSADREELRRAFINVLRNAVQAMGESGTISITTRNEGEAVEIRIADTGPGIPPEIRDRLFEPRFSTKTDGMGLGLAITRKAIEDMAGTISLETELGRGTTVFVRLPVVLNSPPGPLS